MPTSRNHLAINVTLSFLAGLLVLSFPNSVSAESVETTSCTSGTVTTETKVGYNWLSGRDTIDGAVWLGDRFRFEDTRPHRYTRVSFYSNGTSDATCTWVAPSTVTRAIVLTVGGGGGGGTYNGGGGGGGGVYYTPEMAITGGQTYNITVGLGGTAQPASCTNACNGNNGNTSEIFLNNTLVARAQGGGGGGGNGNAGNSISCTTELSRTACGSGGGGAGGDMNGNDINSGGSANTSNTGSSFPQMTTVPRNGGNGATGYVTTTAGGFSTMLSGGGGGAAVTPSSGAQSGARVPCSESMTCRHGGSGHLPSVVGTLAGEIFQYGAGGGGVYRQTLENGGQHAVASSSGQFGAVLGTRSSQDEGGRSAIPSAPAVAARPHLGGGGGGGGSPPFAPWWTTNYVEGSRGGSGVVHIYYYQLPVINGGTNVLSTSFGRNATSNAFTMSGGNNPWNEPTTLLSEVATKTWSLRNSHGQSIPGVSIHATSGIVSVSNSLPVGDIDAIVRVQDAMGTVSTTSLTISVVQALQRPLTFVSPPATPLYPNGEAHTVHIEGGNGNGEISVHIDQTSAGVCELSSNAQQSALTFVTAGTCRVNYQKAGDTEYFDSGVESYDIVVSPRQEQTSQVAFSSLTGQIKKGETHTVTVTGGDGQGAIQIGVASWAAEKCSVDSMETTPTHTIATVSMTSMGSCTLTAQRSASYGWEESLEQSTTFQIYGLRDIAIDTQSFQRIYFYSGTPITETIAATVTEGIPFSVNFSTVSDPSVCTFDRSDLRINGIGTCTITAVENDNSYAASTSSPETIYVVADGDTSAPSISSVSVASAPNQYLAGDTIDIDVQLTERVIITGVPRLQLNTVPSSFATFISGSFSDTLRFRYLVTDQHNSNVFDYAASNSFQLNGATITDFSANPAEVQLPHPGTPQSISGQHSIRVGTPTPPALTEPSAPNITPAPIQPPQLAPAITPVLTVDTGTPPSVTKPLIIIKRGKKLSKAALMKTLRYRSPRGSITTVTRRASSKRSCSVVRSRLTTLRSGTCRITITMKPKKGKTKRTQFVITVR
jgi:hypothetical protein